MINIRDFYGNGDAKTMTLHVIIFFITSEFTKNVKIEHDGYRNSCGASSDSITVFTWFYND